MGAFGLFVFLFVLQWAVPVLAADPVPDGFTTQDITNGLVQPVAFGFTPAGRLYVAEKRGTVQVFDSVSDPTPTQVVDVSNNVHDFWDRGLLGLAVDPEFGSGSDYIYLLYSYDPGNSFGDDCANPTPPPGGPGIGCVVNGQLSRFPINPGGSAGVEQVLLTGRWCAQFPSHTIGDLAFTEEGHLLVTGGDGASFGWADHGQRGNPCGDPMGDPDDRADDEGGALRSQDLRTGADPVGWEGTVLRINKATGAAVDTNPASQDSRIIAHGLRNPFRLTVRPNTSEVWIGDVGWSDWEEIDRITNPGGSVDNFGWPCYEGNNSGSAKHSSYDALDVDICEDLYDAGSGSVVAPFYARPHGVGLSGCPGGGGAISGLAFYEGGNYPNPYDGALFIADYSIACIRVMFPDASFGVPNKANISTFIPDVTAVDLQIGPGGDLYYADITTGRIVRVNYSNAGPTADIQADPTTGSVPLQVSFDGTGSTDPEGDALTYAWDLDGDTQFDDSTNPQPTWTYTTAGPVTVRLRVTDPFLGTDTETIQISPVANQAPVASITAPVSSLTWRVEEMISFSGSATDGGAPLPASALSWEIVLNHCQPGRACHEHVIQNIDDVSSGTFTAPDHAYPSFLTIRLIATDTGGLTDEDEVSIQPETTVVTIASNPSGAQVQAGVEGVLDTFTAPVEITAIVGGSITVNAPSAQTIGGIAYSFSNWSDGGAPSHTISAPAPDTTLTANFVAVGGGGSGGGGAAGGGGGGGSGQEPSFDDVPSGHAFFAEINWLANQRITLGCTDETFCPEDPVTRGQMAVFLARALALLPAPSGRFIDTAGSPYEWAISSVAAAGITQGCAVDRYCPNDPVTREQMASFLVRAFLFPAGDDLFTDDDDSVHEADINALAKSGVTVGCASSLYCPEEVVTREQMAAFLFRSFNS